MSNSIPQIIGVMVSPFAGFWIAGELGTPPLLTAIVVVWAYIKIFDVTTYHDYA